MRPDKKQHYRAFIYGPWAPPQSMQRLVERASPPAAFGSTGFQPVHRTGKMPVPPRIFWGRTSKWEDWGHKKGRPLRNPTGAKPGEVAAMTGRG
jgi:hypothetical protein